MFMKTYLMTMSLINVSVVQHFSTSGREITSFRTFHIYSQISPKFSLKYLKITLFCLWEFRENRRKKGRAFLLGVKEISGCTVEQL
jgi:hypothetical protein